MFKRIKKIIELSKRDPKLVDKLTMDDIVSIPLQGDGKAEFISEGTEQDYLDQKKKDAGLFGLFGLNK